MRPSVAGIQGNRSPEGSLRGGPVPLKPPAHLAERVLRLGQVWLSSDRLRGGFTGARPNVKRACIAIDGARRVGLSEAGPGERVVRVQLGGGRVAFNRPARCRR